MDLLPHRTPNRNAISDTSVSALALAPSPNFNETVSKDDNNVPSPSPQTPRRPDFLARGLSLQMPSRTISMAAPTGLNRAPLSPQLVNRAPLSPQLDTLTSYASPQTSLPRHSRGLDFSRACTNLHHSTLAEQSSPDSSPIITHKGITIGIPSRKASISSMMLDSPNLGPGTTWPQMSLNDRSTVSSSVGSVNMLASDSDSNSEDGDLMDPDDDDPIYATPQVHKLHNTGSITPFANNTASPRPETWSNNFSPAHASLMKNFQRGRFRKERSRKSSSSASGTSAIPSPRTTSPPPLRSIESGSYFAWPRLGSNNNNNNNNNNANTSRRESLALGTDQLNISSGNDSGDEATPTAPTTPGVVRRAVTRRGNLLPKTKGFARIRAALMEESMPIDAEVKREAETIRQVRQRDTDVDVLASSPGLMPTVPGGLDTLEDIPEDTAMGMEDGLVSTTNSGGGLQGQQQRGGSGAPNMNFNIHASRNSAGLNYWNKFDKDLRTPPPPSFPHTRATSSSMSADTTMDSPAAAGATGGRSASVISLPDYSSSIIDPISSSSQNNPHFSQYGGQQYETSSSSSFLTTRKFGKRRREDDFDLYSLKRRAVSPSLSVHGGGGGGGGGNNSPTVAVSASPASVSARSDVGRSDVGGGGVSLSREGTAALSLGSPWGGPPARGGGPVGREGGGGGGGQSEGSRGGSVSGGGAGAGFGGKRVGLQGMVDTNDAIMKMSIE